MTDWRLTLEDWINASDPFKNAIKNIVAANDYGADRRLRDALITELDSFYRGRVMHRAEVDTAWATNQKGTFVRDVLSAALQPALLARIRFVNATPLNQEAQRGPLRTELRTALKNAVSLKVAALELASPAPAPRDRSYSAARDFAAMAVDFSLTWKTNSTRPGELTNNGRDGVGAEDAEMQWIDGHTDALVNAVTERASDVAYPEKRIEIHVKARPCHYCGPRLNTWKAENVAIAPLPVFVYTYYNDQAGLAGKHVYKLDSTAPNGTKYLGTWA
ncbi:hypothetical protein [Polyangium sorediatum]|uniref:Uncharacterized protein n=1 Tax=Polyangium sorediatum TaxID=889274 RepID=A0ABT6P3P9_9BACT|nr:hypothetical protein [Polyangium sorediatum]MDI1434972.1 hypothetical protein [Polyangium sorediatum]